MYSAKVVADSVGPSGVRILSVLTSYPLMVHAEHLRHRIFSFSVASNRAIPTWLILRQVIDDPVIPVWFGKNQGGMSAREELTGWRYAFARWAWLAARWPMVAIVWLLLRIGLHKQLANRLLSPWQWVTVLVTGTEWENFFALRCHPDAQPEMRRAAEMIRDAIAESKPRVLRAGEWHMPFVDVHVDFENAKYEREQFWITMKDDPFLWQKLSAAECARISTMRAHNNGPFPMEKALTLTNKLLSSAHFSPFEHQAQALANDQRVANLRGWRSFRSTIPNEDNFAKLVNQ